MEQEYIDFEIDEIPKRKHKSKATKKKQLQKEGAQTLGPKLPAQANETNKEMLKVEMKQTEGFLRNSFTAQQHVHLNNSLRFADAKAGALVTVNGLVLSYVTNLIEGSLGMSSWLFKGSLVILLLGIVFSILVVFPRNLHSKQKGLVYWEHITNYTQEEYVKAIIDKNEDVERLLKESVENNYAQATILTKKFKQLALGFKISVLGYSVITAGLLVKFFL